MNLIRLTVAIACVASAALFGAALGNQQAAKPSQMGKDAELELLAQWMTGDFDTFAQVAADETAKTASRPTSTCRPAATPSCCSSTTPRGW